MLTITAFRLAASIRETGTRAELAPRSGHLVPTRSGGVFVQEKGPADGIPVVLFHGTAAWSELWRHTSDAVAAAGFHVIAVDLPPFGFSDRPGSYTRADQAARINDVLVALKAAPAIIVGHSFGAGAATELVMRYPERARALVLLDAGARFDGRAVGRAMGDPAEMDSRNPGVAEHHQSGGDEDAARNADREERARAAGVCRHPATADRAARQHRPTSPTGCIISSAPTATPSAPTAMPMRSMKIPVAILWGDKDTVTPVEQALDLRTLLPPQTSLTLLPGLGHIPQIEDPDAFNDALLKTLGKL